MSPSYQTWSKACLISMWAIQVWHLLFRLSAINYVTKKLMNRAVFFTDTAFDVPEEIFYDVVYDSVKNDIFYYFTDGGERLMNLKRRRGVCLVWVN